jgi:hypothetical protein
MSTGLFFILNYFSFTFTYTLLKATPIYNDTIFMVPLMML